MESQNCTVSDQIGGHVPAAEAMIYRAGKCEPRSAVAVGMSSCAGWGLPGPSRFKGVAGSWGRKGWVGTFLACGLLVAAVPTQPLLAEPVRAVGNAAAPDGVGIRLKLEITGFRNCSGRAAVGLFGSKQGFLQVSQRAAGTFVPIVNGRAVVEFAGLKPGTYAAAILHDENQDNKLDTNVIGIPMEGYGFTNDARGVFGPPSFEQAAFHVNRDAQATVHMQYSLF